MELKKDKRGVFFLFIAIALLTISLASVSIFSEIKTRKSISSRISSMNQFVFSLNEDLQRKTFISGFRIIFLHEKRIIDTGNYMQNISQSFPEAFFNGTIENTSTSEETTLFSGVTYQDIISDVSTNANKIGLDITFSNPKITISQDNPWSVNVTLSGRMVVEDRAKLAKWNKTFMITSEIPVNNFEDPLYVINTNGLVVPKINQTPFATFVSGTNVSNLSTHNQNMYYIASSTAPNFLMRLEGNNSASPQGVESLVNLAELSAQGISIKDKSVVDYIYFSSSNPSTNAVQGMPGWFKLDVPHQSVYNVTGIII